MALHWADEMNTIRDAISGTPRIERTRVQIGGSKRSTVPDMDLAAWHGHDEVKKRRTCSHPSAKGLRMAGETLFGSGAL